MDGIDQQIVSCLLADGRATYAEIGDVVGLSAPAVKRRVDRLRADGVIRGFTAVIDPVALGWSTEAYVEVFCQGTVSPDTLRTSPGNVAHAITSACATERSGPPRLARAQTAARSTTPLRTPNARMIAAMGRALTIAVVMPCVVIGPSRTTWSTGSGSR